MTKKPLLTALVLCAGAALMLHFRVHPFMVPDPSKPGNLFFNSTKFLSFLFPLVDLILVTFLFLRRKTAVYGYLLNGLLVIYGTIFMAHFSMAQFSAHSIPSQDWFLKSTLPDIALAWADFFIGKALYDLIIKEQGTGDGKRLELSWKETRSA
jgi:hypothetical protein